MRVLHALGCFPAFWGQPKVEVWLLPQPILGTAPALPHLAQVQASKEVQIPHPSLNCATLHPGNVFLQPKGMISICLQAPGKGH